MLESGISAFGTVWEFLSTNDAFKVIIGVAVGAIALSAFLGLFFRR